MTKALNLYRSILRIHRRLPQDMRFLGDQYVRAEFRNHKTVTDKRYLDQFFSQWTSYLGLLRTQTGADEGNIGKHLDVDLVEKLDDDKAEQLLQLHRASTGSEETRDDIHGTITQPPKRTH